MSTTFAETTEQTVTHNDERCSAALDLLEEVDRAWREGQPPPIEKIRACLVDNKRSLTWPGGER